MRWPIVFAALTCWACVPSAAEQPPGYPLYGDSRLPRGQVAELVTLMPGGTSVGAGSEGLIKSVDGKDVSTLDTAFELLPGCHIVQTSSRVLISNDKIIWRGELGTNTFAMQMKPGNTYVVKLELVDTMNSSGRITMSAIEENATGQEIQRLTPGSERDVQACRQAATSQAGPGADVR
jgi:hypothetical protein